MKIAIVGTGISGNVIAGRLHPHHEIVVFEANRQIGGHTRTVTVSAFGREYDVDTGFMVFNERTYPHFCKLLQTLNCQAQDAEMSFSVRCDMSNLEYQGGSLRGLFAQRSNFLRLRFFRMLWDILRFNRVADTLIEKSYESVSLREVLRQFPSGEWFLEKYLIPMTAAIWSCPPGRIKDFPARFLLEFLRNHGLLQFSDRPTWKTVRGSARRYVEKLTAPFRDRIRTDCAVESVRRFSDHVELRTKYFGAEKFDRIIFACHADQTLAILKDADPAERDVLSAFPYRENLAVMHTDTSILPRRVRAWANWNYRIYPQPDRVVTVTYDLSRLQKLDTPTPILLTLNDDSGIDPSKVLDRNVFRHPAFTTDSTPAQNRIDEISHRRRTYFCGAYWGYGFHEDGVNSALAVAKYFGMGSDDGK